MQETAGMKMEVYSGGFYPEVRKTTAVLDGKDIIGGWKVRWGWRRMNYVVETGLYAAGNPDEKSPVLVTANYKLSFDSLRKNLENINAWILVIDTKGINVWCAAGKGTFSADEIVRQISLANLEEIVSHRTLVLPQLSATGVNGSELYRKSGFRAVFGPVRAEDIPAYLASGCRKTDKMKLVRFSLIDRLVLAPVEFVSSFRLLSWLFLFSLLYTAAIYRGVNVTGLFAEWAIYAGSVFAGTFFTAALLPFIPFRPFAVKGAVAGIVFASIYLLFFPSGIAGAISVYLIAAALSSFFALNFTGSSTFTSLSGVKREVKIAVPLQIAAAAAGFIIRIFIIL